MKTLARVGTGVGLLLMAVGGSSLVMTITKLVRILAHHDPAGAQAMLADGISGAILWLVITAVVTPAGILMFVFCRRLVAA